MGSERHRELVSSFGSLLWAQWGALGAPAAIEPSRALVDPEALLVATAAFTASHPDDRLRDGAISWAVARHPLVSAIRLKALVRRHSDDDTAEHARVLLTQAAASITKRVSWPVAERAPRWQPSTEMRRIEYSAPGLFRLKCRSLFATTARAEAVAVLAAASSALGLAVLEQRTLYSRSQIEDGLRQLGDLGWVDRYTVGNAHRFDLSPLARTKLDVEFRDVRVGAGPYDYVVATPLPDWIDWDARFSLARMLLEVSTKVDDVATLEALSLIRGLEAEFAALYHPVPEALGADEELTDAAERIAQWLPHAMDRLAGRGLLG